MELTRSQKEKIAKELIESDMSLIPEQREVANAIEELPTITDGDLDRFIEDTVCGLDDLRTRLYTAMSADLETMAEFGDSEIELIEELTIATPDIIAVYVTTFLGEEYNIADDLQGLVQTIFMETADERAETVKEDVLITMDRIKNHNDFTALYSDLTAALFDQEENEDRWKELLEMVLYRQRYNHAA